MSTPGGSPLRQIAGDRSRLADSESRCASKHQLALSVRAATLPASRTARTRRVQHDPLLLLGLLHAVREESPQRPSAASRARVLPSPVRRPFVPPPKARRRHRLPRLTQLGEHPFGPLGRRRRAPQSVVPGRVRAGSQLGVGRVDDVGQLRPIDWSVSASQSRYVAADEVLIAEVSRGGATEPATMSRDWR